MTTKERIKLCRLLEKVAIHEEYSKKLGIKDVSKLIETPNIKKQN